MTPDASPRDRAEVEEANQRFYRAFESLDLSEMDAIWAHGDHVACVHPGWRRLHGWEDVRRSWAAIFATNVFERSGARWLLVHHHASHILAPQDSRPEAA